MSKARNRASYSPGSYLKESMDEMMMSQHEFAARLGVSDKLVSEIISEKASVSYETSTKLAAFFGTTTNVWIDLQTNYDNYRHDQDKSAQLDREGALLKMIDRQFLIDLKLVSKDETTEDSLINLHKALGVADLSALQKVDLFAVLRSPSVKELDTKRLVNANAWIALALAKAKEESGSDFDAKKLESAIVEIRSMTSERPEVFLPRMKQALSDAGIRLVILPYLKNSELTGVVKWFSDINQVMLALNCKGKYADIFWFTLFHELGHVRQQDRRRVIVSGSSDAAEVNADEFAKNTLIPIREYELFLASGAYQTEAGVINFAKTVGVHPGIVVGRLHKENRIPQANLNGLRVQFIVLTQ